MYIEREICFIWELESLKKTKLCSGFDMCLEYLQENSLFGGNKYILFNLYEILKS